MQKKTREAHKRRSDVMSCFAREKEMMIGFRIAKVLSEPSYDATALLSSIRGRKSTGMMSSVVFAF
jgi:hypothetical protein